MKMSSDRSARRCITSVDDRRCERGHQHTAPGLRLRTATRVASLHTCVVTGGLSPLRAHPRRLERSRFVSRRSAHGSRPCLGGPIQPPTACYRHSHPQRGPNAARNMALYAGVRAVTSHRRLERSRVGLVLRAVRAHVAAVPGRLVVDDEKRSQKKDRKKDRKKRAKTCSSQKDRKTYVGIMIASTSSSTMKKDDYVCC